MIFVIFIHATFMAEVTDRRAVEEHDEFATAFRRGDILGQDRLFLEI